MPAAAFHREELPLFAVVPGDGSVAYGIRLDGSGGDWAIDLVNYKPVSSGVVGAGSLLLDADHNILNGRIITTLRSWDRLTVAASEVGDGSLLPPGVDITHTETENGVYLLNTGASSSANPPAQSAWLVMWISGGSSSFLIVRGAVANLAVHEGDVLSATDVDFDGGNVNLQAQAIRLSGQNPGVKVIRNASYVANVEHRLYGVWGAYDAKSACAPLLGSCVTSDTPGDLCAASACDFTKISSRTPDGQVSTSEVNEYEGGEPGAYSFTIDEKIDLYGAYAPHAGIRLSEDFVYLNGADVAVPR